MFLPPEGAPSNYYGKSGVGFSFFNSEGDSIGSVSYLAATQHPIHLTVCPGDSARTAVQITQSTNQHYSIRVSDLLSMIDIDENEIAMIAMTFTTYSSTYPYPSVTAELWVDNVNIFFG